MGRLHSGGTAYVITVSPVLGRNASLPPALAECVQTKKGSPRPYKIPLYLLIKTTNGTRSFKYTVRSIANYIVAFVDSSLFVFAYNHGNSFPQNGGGAQKLFGKQTAVLVTRLPINRLALCILPQTTDFPVNKMIRDNVN